MVELYPPIEPYAQGLLEVGDGNHVYWETFGNPDGKPAVMVHGGPGQGITPNMRRMFDPARYRAVLFDQRGSWGTTLALVYAERYPQRVSQIMLSAISTTRRSEIDCLCAPDGILRPAGQERGGQQVGHLGGDTKRARDAQHARQIRRPLTSDCIQTG